jgi:hypothetical protein
VVYFLLVFAVGWVLGPIRELWAATRFGRITALLCEAIIMALAMFSVARWVIGRFDVPQTAGSTIPMGLVAFAILLPAKIAGVLWVRRIPQRISGELRDGPRRHLTVHVPAFCRDADSHHAINT